MTSLIVPQFPTPAHPSRCCTLQAVLRHWVQLPQEQQRTAFQQACMAAADASKAAGKGQASAAQEAWMGLEECLEVCADEWLHTT